MNNYIKLIDNLSTTLPIITAVGVIVGIYYYKKLNKAYKILTLLLFLSLTCEILSYISAKVFGSNLIFINAFAIIEMILIYSFLKTNKFPYKKTIDCIFYILLLFNIYEILTIDYQNFDMFQAYSRSVNSIFLFANLILIIIEKLKKEQYDPSNKIFFILPFYLVINALLYLPLNLLINYKDIRVFIVWFTSALNMTTFYCIIIYQIWNFGKRQKI